MATVSSFVQVEGTWEEIVRRADQFAGKRVRITVLPEDEHDTKRAACEIHEHDVVRVRHDLESEGYSLRAGMIGAIVSVYREGEAFAVEFPDLDSGSAVVTLRRNQIEKTTSTAATPILTQGTPLRGRAAVLEVSAIPERYLRMASAISLALE